MKTRTLLTFILLCVITLGGWASEPLQYQIEGAGTGVQGTYLVKVYVISKKSRPEASVMLKCAVHGVLFRGFTDKKSRTTQRPLAGSPTVEHERSDFFEPFFEDKGQYLNYVSMLSTGYEVVKMAKKEYKIGATFSVSKDLLRKDLESAGVLKKLSSGF